MDDAVVWPRVGVGGINGVDAEAVSAAEGGRCSRSIVSISSRGVAFVAVPIGEEMLSGAAALTSSCDSADSATPPPPFCDLRENGADSERERESD